MARPKRTIPWLGWRDGVAYAFWYDEAARETQRRSLRTRDPVEAKNRFIAFLQEGGSAQPRGTDELTVSQALDDYHREHVVPHCADPVRQENAISHLKAFFGDLPLLRIDIPMSRSYADARRGGVIGGGRREKNPVGSGSTIRRELNVLVAASNHARKWKRTTLDISVELPPEKRLGEDDEAPYYTRDELDLLLSMADGELHHFIVLSYYSGARRRAIQDMTRPQVRWAQKQIVLQPPERRKTKKRRPIVPILPAMEGPLQALDAAAKEAGRVRLFETADFYRPFKQLCESVGLADRSHPHLLRHTRATHLLQDGIPLYSVARLLGDTLATVERVYGHHSHEHLAELIGER